VSLPAGVKRVARRGMKVGATREAGREGARSEARSEAARRGARAARGEGVPSCEWGWG